VLHQAIPAFVLFPTESNSFPFPSGTGGIIHTISIQTIAIIGVYIIGTSIIGSFHTIGAHSLIVSINSNDSTIVGISMVVTILSTSLDLTTFLMSIYLSPCQGI
jgi:hypothetical protein